MLRLVVKPKPGFIDILRYPSRDSKDESQITRKKTFIQLSCVKKLHKSIAVTGIRQSYVIKLHKNIVVTGIRQSYVKKFTGVA